MAKKRSTQTPRLFRDPSGQQTMFEKSLEEELEEQQQQPVECLGQTFANDDARREHFLARLREGLEELHDKLGGVPFTTVDDAVARMQSLEKWPMGQPDRLRELAERMREGVQGSKFKAQGSKFKVQGSRVPPTLNLEPANLELLQLWKDGVGFPHGEIEDILNLSDPPYYTACPNPFLGEFVACYGKPYDRSQDYLRHPFASDVAEGKGGRIYKAHTYHTKVPHEAIARYILHYTEPGDIVLDAFAGCGMTGVAAQFCGAPEVSFREAIATSMPEVSWGSRRAVLVDLSPFATFLSHNMTFPWSADRFQEEAAALIARAQDCLPPSIYGVPSVNYVLWSQVLLCTNCGADISFADAVIAPDGSMVSSFDCPSCSVELTKSICENRHASVFDPILGQAVERNEYRPRYVARDSADLEELNASDLSAIQAGERLSFDGVPVVPLMFDGREWGDMYRAGYHFGVTHVHHFWTPRNLAVLSAMWRQASSMEHANQMRFVLTSFMVKTGSLMHNVSVKDGRVNLAGQIFNTLQIPSLSAERNLFQLAEGKVADLTHVFALHKLPGGCMVSTSSAATVAIPGDSVDYVFVDPPFGSNIMYSEMSFLYEAWLGTYTNSVPEAIISPGQSKDLARYRTAMGRCFAEIARVLKPGRWVTVAFHNSRNDVWNGLQESLQGAGLVIADVRVLDKGQGTYKQMTTAGAVEKDLAISAYKPNDGLEQRFKLEAGTEEGAWDFVRTHLRQLPVFVEQGGKAEVIAERQNYLLFDRMVAFHVQRGVTVPLSAGEFYAGIVQRFSERDGMYFLPEQVAEYDKRRLTTKELQQLQLIVNDEASAIQWLRQQLNEKPQTFSDLFPQFVKELGGWVKHEKPLELLDLLGDNFLCYQGGGEVPSQIHSYLSSNSRDLRNLPKDDPTLQAKAKDRWYVPDPNKAADLEKLRERALLKEFWDYLPPGYHPAKRDATQSPLPGMAADSTPVPKGKKMRVLRLEAVRAGFKHCWQERDYRTIIAVAQRLPENVLQEDPKLLMWYDQAVTRVGGEG
jgi:16S rRNA G966 N2-methylase RsmD